MLNEIAKRESFIVILTILIHSDSHALCESTSSALIPMSFVHRTISFALISAHVLTIPSD
jgi:hypothetical protein